MIEPEKRVWCDCQRGIVGVSEGEEWQVNLGKQTRGSQSSSTQSIVHRWVVGCKLFVHNEINIEMARSI